MSTGVVVTPYLPVPETSGGRKRAARLIRAMQEEGVDPIVLTTDPGVEEGLAEARERGWTVEAFALTSTPRTRLEAHVRREPGETHRALVSRLNELAPTASFIQFEDIWAAHYVLRVDGGTRCFLSLYNVDSTARTDPSWVRVPRSTRELSTRWRLRRMASIEGRAARRATVTVCVSEADRAYYDAVGAQRTELVPNGVDDELFELPADGGGGDVLFFGQLAYPPNAMGVLGFVRSAWPRIAEAVPSARLRIAGNSPSDALRSAAAAVPRADVLGFVPSVTDELRRARCVVAPIPFGGGTRTKVLEAVAAGRPVVGTALGVEGIGFEHERHGFVAETPEALAEQTIRLLEDRDLAARMGADGRGLAERYRWRRVVEPLRPLYRDPGQSST